MSTTRLWGQVLDTIPKFGTALPLLVPNWLTSPLKLGAQLLGIWEWSELITYQGSDESKYAWNQGG